MGAVSDSDPERAEHWKDVRTAVDAASDATRVRDQEALQDAAAALTTRLALSAKRRGPNLCQLPATAAEQTAGNPVPLAIGAAFSIWSQPKCNGCDVAPVAVWGMNVRPAAV